MKCCHSYQHQGIGHILALGLFLLLMCVHMSGGVCTYVWVCAYVWGGGGVVCVCVCVCNVVTMLCVACSLSDVPAPWIVLEYLHNGDMKQFLIVSE